MSGSRWSLPRAAAWAWALEVATGTGQVSQRVAVHQSRQRAVTPRRAPRDPLLVVRRGVGARRRRRQIW